jgi:uridine kinase
VSRAHLSLSIQDSFYKPLTPEQSERAFRNDYDFDSPEAIDFDVLVDKLKDIKNGYIRHLRYTTHTQND